MSEALIEGVRKSLAELRAGKKGTLYRPKQSEDLRSIRARLQFTQEQLARRLEVSVDTVRSWEQEKRNISRRNWSKIMALLDTQI